LRGSHLEGGKVAADADRARIGVDRQQRVDALLRLEFVAPAPSGVAPRNPAARISRICTLVCP
jgi:hypothetical protein